MNTDTVDLSSDGDSDSCLNDLPAVDCCFDAPIVLGGAESYTYTSISGSTASVDNEGSTAKNRKGRRKSGESIGSNTNRKTTAAERQAMKKKLALERQAAKEANKMYKPGECMKHMTVELHPLLMDKWYCADISREVSTSGAKLKSVPTLCDSGLVLWSRDIMPTLVSVQGLVELTPRHQRCERGLYVLDAEGVSELVATHSLARKLLEVKSLAACDVTLVVYGTKDYFKSSVRRTNNSSKKLMTEFDLEKAVTDLLVTASCDTIIVNTPNELALTIVQFTKAIAEEPHKKAKRALDEQAEFYMRGDNKKCVAVDKEGTMANLLTWCRFEITKCIGLSRLWQQMLAILPLSSLETSRALCREFPEPRRLCEVLKSPGGVNTVAATGVFRAAVSSARARRVGPEFANKLHTLFTAEDGQALIE